MTRKVSTLKCVDFFCGGGGMSQGLSGAGIKIIGALDNDPDCRETYEENHKDSQFILSDITKMDEKDLTKRLGIRKNDDDLIFVGCSPCQYWSIINGRIDSERKEKSHASRNLLHDFLRFVKYYKPGFVLVENVRNIRNNEKDSGLLDLLTFFDNNGYEFKQGVLCAADYEVPQTRRRYVLVASRTVKNIELPKVNKKKVSVRDAIGKQEPIKAGETLLGDSLHRSSFLNEDNIARLKQTPEGGGRESWANNSKLIINAYKDKPHSFFRDNYGRMSWDKQAPTITTKFFSLGCGKFGHPAQNRAISLREGALLQTFHPKYKFKTKSMAATAKLIGNAVPPKLAWHIGKMLVELRKGV